MKVAIIGSGPLAIEMGIRLFLEEASVTIFTKGELGGAAEGKMKAVPGRKTRA